MKRVVSVVLVVVLMGMTSLLNIVYSQSYMSREYCSVKIKGDTIYFYLNNPSSEEIRHVYTTSKHIDYYIFSKNFFYHYGANKQFISAITYIDIPPRGRVLVDSYTLPKSLSFPVYIYADFLVCNPRLFVIDKGRIREEIPSLFSAKVNINHLYVKIGQTLSVTVSLVSRVPLSRDFYIDIDFSPPPVLTVFYNDGSIESETFTGTTVRLWGGEDILFIKHIKVKNPVKAIYVLFDSVSFRVKGGGQYIEKMPPISVNVYTISPSDEPVITDVPYWAENDVFTMYRKYILPKSIFVDMEKPATREEVMRGIASLFFVPAMSFSHTFTDVRRYIWGSYLSGLYWYHIIEGFPDGTVRGDTYLTRAQMAALIGRLLPPRPQAISFKDVSKSAWYYPYIRAIAGYNILKGWDDKFYPDKPLTKAEAVVILYRILQLKR